MPDTFSQVQVQVAKEYKEPKAEMRSVRAFGAFPPFGPFPPPSFNPPMGTVGKGGAIEVKSPVGGNEFTAIGLGKPLAVEWRWVYLGKKIGSRSDLFLASSVRRLPIFDAAPRAVSVLWEDIRPGESFASIPTTVPGTRLIYYTPALTDRGITVQLEMIFDRFPDQGVQQIGSLLQGAAAVPIFAPASAYLLGAGVLVKAVGKLAERMIDGKALFHEWFDLSFEQAGNFNSREGYVVLSDGSDVREGARAGTLVFHPEEGLKHAATGLPYSGPSAYVVLSLDGRERRDYKDFAPRLASAALLDRFLHAGESRPAATELLLEGIKAFNDVAFRNQALETKGELAELRPDDPRRSALQAALEAFNKNITDPSLRIPLN